MACSVLNAFFCDETAEGFHKRPQVSLYSMHHHGLHERLLAKAVVWMALFTVACISVSFMYSKSQRELFSKWVPIPVKSRIRELFAEDYDIEDSKDDAKQACDTSKHDWNSTTSPAAVCRDAPRAARMPGRVDDDAALYDQADNDRRGPLVPDDTYDKSPPKGISDTSLAPGPWPIKDSSERIRKAANNCRPGSGVALPNDSLATLQKWRQIQDLWWACGKKLARGFAGNNEACKKDGLRKGDPRVRF